ncbi:CARDB domain-containing protein [Undibacterium flavidum]|uniref:Discoidin domain-containing protein n=1 Tax=Undibacterium flavidum TaxID=2762297 RepID=A0ABR6Y8I1_9BURK|nr:CARDB domain-containing protein [Undibacterium flavidum]MBC3872944.1 discoidin domain-containing protein [Undibacterium flavidum]
MKLNRQTIRLGSSFLLMTLSLFWWVLARADFPSTSSFPNTGFYQARHLKDKNDVSVIQLTGNYGIKSGDGQVNVEPRTVIAKEFYRTHPDHYDFIVVFSNFEFDTGDALASHLGVQNKVKGLGIPQFDNTKEFGSSGKLLGYIDMAALSRYTTNPFNPDFESVLRTFSHEFLHQWGARVRFKAADGTLSTALLGKDNSHWSFLLNSGASVEYGNQWRDNSDGSFTSTGGYQFFSPLDLYLMGMYKKNEVPTFFLIDNPNIDKNRLPLSGVTVSGVRREISIEDVIAAEGPRIPSADNSQKEFRLGFVLLSRAGAEPTDAEIAALNGIRKAINTRLAVMTGGRAIAHSYSELAVLGKDDSSNNTQSGQVRSGGANIPDGLAWLKNQQSIDGYWEDNPFTKVRDTVFAFETLNDLDGVGFVGKQKTLSWLTGQNPGNTDYIARSLRTLTGAGVNSPDQVDKVLAMQNLDGGWGVSLSYQSNPLDTALAILALRSLDTSLVKEKLDRAVAFLLANQNVDGGWGNLTGGVSRTSVTATALQSLSGRSIPTSASSKIISFLAQRQNSDGGFGDSPSTVHDTANVVLALLTQNALGQIRAADATSYVASTQLIDGSWNKSAYSTALALRLLRSSGLFNWALTDLKIASEGLLDGQQTVVSFKVSNNGTSTAPAGKVRVFDGDPALASQQIGSDISIPALAVGANVELKVLWNTFGKAGAHTLYALVDPENTIQEVTKSDNRQQINVTVREAPAAVELAINASDMIISPPHPNRLPTIFSISGPIFNIGKTDAPNVRVVLREGEGSDAKVIDERVLNLLGRSQQVVNFSGTVLRPGVSKYAVLIDPENLITESDKSNNLASLSVETTPSLDLEIRHGETVLARSPVYVGSDAQFKVKIRNAGTIDSPPFKVRYFVSNGVKNVEVANRTVQIAAGSAVDQDVVWRAEFGGDLVFHVELDSDNILTEIDKTNNADQISFKVLEANGANLAVSFKDLVISPALNIENQELTVSQIVRNIGNLAASDIEVGFYDGDPALGRLFAPIQKIANLNPGESVTVVAKWPRLPDALEHMIFVSVDPYKKQSEITREDNAAFAMITPLTMTDLAISAADIVLTPASPKPGDTVTVSVKLNNLGKQSAKNIVVRLYDGDPSQNGKAIGTDKIIPVLAGLESTTLDYIFPAGAVSLTRSLFVLVDPDNAIEEKNKTNNFARRDLIVQDSDFYVSNRYFSPNGDGVKDDTVLSFRLQTSTDVSVNILNKYGKTVRTFAGEQFKNAQTGSVTWDGLNQLGVVVSDGEYRIRVLDSKASLLGEVRVTIDTNRSSIIDAIDTGYEQFTNLSCEIGDARWQQASKSLRVTADEERIFLFNQRDYYTSPNFLSTFYRELTNGSDLTPVLSSELLNLPDWNRYFGMSLNGEKLAFTRVQKIAAGQYQEQLWIASGDGRAVKQIRVEPQGSFDTNPGGSDLNGDGSAYIAKVNNAILSIPTDGVSAETVLFSNADVGSGSLGDLIFSPDQNKVLVPVYGSQGVDYFVIDTLTGHRRKMSDTLPRGDFSIRKWAPNSKLFAIGGKLSELGIESANRIDARIYVFDTEFNVVKSFETAVGNASIENGEGKIANLAWASSSTEFVFGFSTCFESCRSESIASNSVAHKLAGPPVVLGGYSGPQHVMVKADLSSGELEYVESARIQTRQVNAESVMYAWAPNERTVIRQLGNDCENQAEQTCIDAVLLDDANKVRPLFKNWHSSADLTNNRSDIRMSLQGFLPSGRKLMFSSWRAARDSSSSCYESGPDQYSFGSLLNMSLDLQPLRSATIGGLILRGTATDQNFSRYMIEYAAASTPNDWKTVVPGSSTPIIDGVFTNWVPPAFGHYYLRLTVEDLAGNKRQQIRRISWMDTPSITDLYKDTEFVSPNGDSVQDVLKLHYRVLDPVHLEFTVYDANNAAIRSVSRDHYSIGQEAFFVWDGRDDQGRTVSDGRYRVAVQSYEFFVNIDNTPPDSLLSLTSAYGFRFDQEKGAKFVAYVPKLTWASSDQNYASMLIERVSANNSNEWQEFGRFPAIKDEGAELLDPKGFVGTKYRMIVSDKAGTKTSSSTAPAAQELFLLNFAEHSRTNPPENMRWKQIVSVPYSNAEKIGGIPFLSGISGAAPVRLIFAETLRKGINKVVLQFKERLVSEKDLPLSALDGATWNEVPISSFLQHDILKNDYVSVGSTPTDHFFEFLWDLKGIKSRTDYIVRLKVVDDDTNEFVAMSPYLIRIDNHFTIAGVKDYRGGVEQAIEVLAQIVWNEPMIRADLLISSTDDPRYLTERLIQTVQNPNDLYTHYLGTELLKDLSLHSCDRYSIRLKGTTASGDVVYTQSNVLPTHCLGVNWVAGPETSLVCNATPSSKLQFTLSPYAKDGRKLTQLLLGRLTADGREEIIHNWNDITQSEYVFSIDTSNIASGEKQFFARIINEDGKVATEILSIPVVHTAPTARITYPSDGQKMCGIKARSPLDLKKLVNVVAIEGSITSDSNVSYALEFGKGSNPTDWKTFSPAGVEKTRTGFSGLRQSAQRIRPPALPPTFCSYPDSKLCDDFHPLQWSSANVQLDENFPGSVARSGELGRLGLFENEQIEGDISVRLRVFNAAGYQSCSAPVQFALDNQLQLNPSSIDRKVFSPKASSLPDHVSLKISPAESVTVDIHVYSAQRNEQGDTIAIGSSIRHLAQTQSLIAGEYAYDWDGRATDGKIVTDGLYLLRVVYEDSCGNTKEVDHVVEVDSTPPTILVTAPIRDAKLGLIAQINGAIRDANFMSYTVQYALASNPEFWITIENGSKPTPTQVSEQGLATWNTLGLSGLLSLRVVAQDSVGNNSVVSMPIEITTRNDLISYLESAPAIFSPNGDGKRDMATIRYALLSPAKVKLEILRDTIDGSLVKTLINDEVLNSGAAVRLWDGTNLLGQLERDGLYFAKMTATSLDNASVKQEVATQIVLDNVAPKATITYPKTNFVTAKGNVSYAVSDAYLDTYKVYFAANAVTNTSGTNWQLVAEGAVDQVAAAANSLEGLPEAKYGVKIVAVDKAENLTESTKFFEIDNTPPKISFDLPTNESYVSAKKGLVKLSATITEKNLATYKLRYGQGNPSENFSDIISGDSLQSSELVKFWDVSQILDGTYTLWLKANDLAGLTNQATLSVTVDNTLPVASISAPLDLSYVKRGMDIVGTASDTNFHDYKIEIAAGSKRLADRWSLLSTSTTAVSSGALLNWQQLPSDGTHTLKLTVTDKAGNTTETLSEIIVDTVAPGVVTNVEVKLENRQDARLSWSASVENDVVGYAIFRNGVRINSEVVKGNTYVDSSLLNGTYSYTIRAIDRAGWEGLNSNSVSLVVDQTGPTAQIFTPARGSLVSSLLDIKGTANSSLGLKEYRLYVGAGDKPTVWQQLRRSSISTIADVLGSWNTLGLPENSVQTLKLEVEDISGQIATDSVTISVDNVSPLSPTSLTANANADTVTLSWTPSASSDLAGYILYRDERVANAIGAVIGSLKPYLIVPSNFVDLKVADGLHTYAVQAMDRAENLSALSNTVSVTLDNRAPHASIIKPVDGTKFDKTIYLLATAADTDIATVQFQYKSLVDNVWTNFSGPVSKVPYETNWTPIGTAYGDYLLQAVATDVTGHTDAAPVAIKVSYKNLTVPDTVNGLKAKVDGGNVNLTWNSNTSNELAGYVVDRIDPAGKIVRLTNAPVNGLSFVDENLDDASYRYRIYAVSTNEIMSKPSTDVTALVYTPAIVQPYTPTLDTTYGLIGKGLAKNKVLLSSNASVIAQFDAIEDGTFAKADIPLNSGENIFTLNQKDADGNVSKSINFHVVKADIPSAPVGLAGSSNGLNATINWTPNVDVGIRGYHVQVNGINNVEIASGTIATASSSNPNYYAEPSNAIDGNLSTAWRPDPQLAEQNQWLSLSYAQTVTVQQIKVVSQNILSDYDIEAWDGQVWVPVAGIRGNTSIHVETILSRPYLTNQLRIKLIKSKYGESSIDEVLVSIIPTQTENTWSGQVKNGINNFSVFAQNSSGVFSAPANLRQTIGDVVAPDAVVLSSAVDASSVVLNWTESIAADLAAYEVFRDGISIAKIVDLQNRRFVDKELPNGSYRYTVKALDALNNASPSSNESVASISVNIPSGPINLTLAPVASGNALKLMWNAPAIGAVPASYQILRSNNSSGPYQPIAQQITNLNYLDNALKNGEIYFYLVTAMDKLGNVQVQSNQVSGKPSDTLAPISPVIFMPVTGNMSVTTTKPVINISGMAEPGATVSLIRNQAVLDVGMTSKDVVKKTIRVSNIFDSFNMSADGQHLALVGRSLTLLDLDTGLSKVVPGAIQPNAAIWSADGSTVGFVQYDSQVDHLSIYSFQEGQETIRRESDLQIADRSFTWSPDGMSIAAVGARDQNEQGLWLIDRATKNLRLLISANMWELSGKLVWSPNGKWLAYQRNQILNVLNLETGISVEVISGRESSSASWSSDSSRLLYQFRNANGNSQVALYQPETGLTRVIGEDRLNNGDDLYPHFLPGVSGDYLTLEGSNLVVHSSDGNIKSVVANDAQAASDKTLVTRSGLLLYQATSDNSDLVLTRVTPAGYFQFPAVKLRAGENLFTAHASDQFGNRGSESEPVRVTLNAGPMPDLLAELQDIVLLPSTPLLGEKSRVTAQIRNQGNLPANNFRVNVKLRAPDGIVLNLLDEIVPSLAGASNVIYPIDWTPVQAGTYTLTLSLDPLEAVQESNETNNSVVREFSVAANAIPGLSVKTDSATYAANVPVDVNFVVTNPGSLFSGVIKSSIEDQNGFLVSELGEISVKDLKFGQTIQSSAHWNTGSLYAGAYRVVAKLYNNVNALIDTGTTIFSVNSVQNVQANLITDKAQYQTQQTVQLNAKIQLNGNESLQNSLATLQIFNAKGEVVYQSEQALETLYTGTPTAINFAWNTSAMSLGMYRATLRVSVNSTRLADVDASFEVIRNVVEQVEGSIIVDAANVAPGDRLAISYSVKNVGTVSLTGTPVILNVLDPESGKIVAHYQTTVNLNEGTEAKGQAWFEVDSWPIKPLQILMSAEISGKLIALDRGILRVVDRLPPTLTILTPLPSQYFNSNLLALSVRSNDKDTRVAKVEYSIDGTSWNILPPQGSGADIYGLKLTGLPDGLLSIFLRTTDIANNTSQPVNLNAQVDNLAPQISVTGVTDGGKYLNSVIPIVNVTDLNLNAVSITLDEQNFVSATPVTISGSHTLKVVAEDKAGNTTTRIIQFFIGNLPRVELLTPTANAIVRLPLTLAAQAFSDGSSIVKIEYAVNGAAWIDMQVNSGAQCQALLTGLTDSVHSFSLRATDALGQMSEVVSTNIQVDNTAPVIAVSGVADAQQYTSAVTPVITVTDTNLLTTKLLLDGVSYVSGTVIAKSGAHVLQIDADDKAGNQVSKTIRFQIAYAAPVVNVLAPLSGKFVRTPLTLSASATSASSTISRVEYQVNGGVWGAMSVAAPNFVATITDLPDGAYKLNVRATDDESQTSAIAGVDVIVDNTAPVIAVSGVTDAQQYTSAVTPVITVTDTNLLTTKLLLDGVSYVSGTAVNKSGAHVLQIDADDKAGNQVSKTIRFQIAYAAPVVNVLAPLSGKFVRTPLTLSASATSASSTISRVEYQVNGGVWGAMSVAAPNFVATITDLPDGAYKLNVRATDAESQTSAIAGVDVIVDNTAPVIAVSGVTDAQQYTSAVTPVITVTDTNLLTTKLLLDGVSYVSGTVVNKSGAHILQIDADDKAGNQVSRTIRFQIAYAAPVVNVLAPLSGKFVRTPLTLSASATSASSTISRVEYQVNGGAWEAMSVAAPNFVATITDLPDGAYKLNVRATDAESQTSAIAGVDVIVDNTAPVIAVSGVTDAQQYTSAVTPVITVTDTNLLTTKLLLDGVSYVSGTVVNKSGAHILQIDADDKAGNQVSKTIRFQITLAIPTVTITAPINGLNVRTPMTLTATANSSASTIAKLEYQVDSGAWSLMTMAGTQYQSVISTMTEGPHKARVRATDNLEQVSNVAEVDFVVDNSELVGTMTLSAKDIPVGDPILVSFAVTNSGKVALSNLPLKLSIIDAASKKVVAEYPYSINLAIAAKYSASTSWTTTGTAGSNYQVALSATVAGKEQILVQDKFALSEPKVKVTINQQTSSWQSVLVYSACKRASDDYLGQCGATPIPIENSSALAICDASRAQMLDLYLDGLGVAHKVTSSPSTFLNELRSGLYSTVWLSNGATNIAEPAGAEVRAAIVRGNSMLLDGLGDSRNTQISQCSGVNYNGKYSVADQVLNMSGNLFAPGSFRITNSPVKLAATAGSLPQAKMNSATPTDAIVSGQLANGKTLTFGFDLEETLRSQSIDGRWFDVMTKSFDYLKSDAIAPQDLVTGQVFNLSTTIKNDGKAVVLQIIQTLPADAQIIGLEPFGLVTNSPTGQVVTWTIPVAPNETKYLKARLRAPTMAGHFQVTTTSNQVVLLNITKLQTQTFDIDVKSGAQLLTQLISQISTMSFTDPEKIAIRSAVIDELSRAQLAMMTSSNDEVLRRLLVVQSRLPRIDTNGTQGILLAKLIGIAEWKISK